MSWVSGCLLNEIDAKLWTPMSEGFNLKECTSYIVRYFPLGVAQDDVDTYLLDAFNLIAHLDCEPTTPNCNTKLKDRPDLFAVKVQKNILLQVEDFHSSQLPYLF